MALCERPGGKCWYYVYTYIDPETGKKKEKWKSTGIPCSRKSERARDEAKRIGERMRDEFLEEMRQKQAGKKIIHQKRESKSQSTLSEYAGYWLSEIKGSVEDSTLHSYEGPLKKHILPRLGDIILSEIDQYDLKEFINAELQECDERQKEIDRLKEEAGGDIKVKSDKRPYYQSIKKHLRILNMMLNYAVSEGDLTENVVGKINPQVLKKIPQSEFESHPYNKKEIAKLREVIKGSHLEPVIILASYLGLRREEALGLRWSDIDFENQRVYIRNVCRLVGSKIEYKEKTKTKSSRASMPMISGLVNYLLELREQQMRDKEFFGSGYTDSDLVCRWNDGRPIKPGNVTQGYKRLLEKAGLRITRFHDLRHTVGTIILEETGDLKAASTVLRHADIGITANTYINPDEEFVKKGLEALETSSEE